MFELDGPSLESYQLLFAAVNELCSLRARCGILRAAGDVYEPEITMPALPTSINRSKILVGLSPIRHHRQNDICGRPYLFLANNSVISCQTKFSCRTNGVGAVEYNRPDIVFGISNSFLSKKARRTT